MNHKSSDEGTTPELPPSTNFPTYTQSGGGLNIDMCGGGSRVVGSIGSAGLVTKFEPSTSKKPTEYGSDALNLSPRGSNVLPRCALVDGITRRALFNVWNEEQDPKRKIDAVLSLVRSRMDSDKYENQQQLKFRKIVKNFCSFVGKKWMMGHRNEKFFSKSKDAWLSVE
ncbi:hypothetical protein TNCV_984661 [Trichonephila clavipes]|nr:hypothetical protein TNCV_984661 [Trichonephila clavipes]